MSTGSLAEASMASEEARTAEVDCRPPSPQDEAPEEGTAASLGGEESGPSRPKAEVSGPEGGATRLGRGWTKERFRRSTCKAPQQDNSCDCGVYVIVYVEQMLARLAATVPEDDLMWRGGVFDDRWFDAKYVRNKRKEMKSLIAHLAEGNDAATFAPKWKQPLIRPRARDCDDDPSKLRTRRSKRAHGGDILGNASEARDLGRKSRGNAPEARAQRPSKRQQTLHASERSPQRSTERQISGGLGSLDYDVDDVVSCTPADLAEQSDAEEGEGREQEELFRTAEMSASYERIPERMADYVRATQVTGVKASTP